jgi:drug/metabolite transporter (DMT)-like permease
LSVDVAGVACVAGACASWAVDNALSQRLSIRDPVAVARAKALAAGGFNVVLGLATGDAFPSVVHVCAALLTGSLGYGASIVLNLLAVRAAGAARQAAYFATAPFIGAITAVLLLRERPSTLQLAAAAVMATGVVLIVLARHAHRHVHDVIEHEHAHVHDEHHAHLHEGPVIEPHSHVHRHARLAHDHAHLPDLHHRHDH